MFLTALTGVTVRVFFFWGGGEEEGGRQKEPVGQGATCALERIKQRYSLLCWPIVYFLPFSCHILRSLQHFPTFLTEHISLLCVCVRALLSLCQTRVLNVSSSYSFFFTAIFVLFVTAPSLYSLAAVVTPDQHITLHMAVEVGAAAADDEYCCCCCCCSTFPNY